MYYINYLELGSYHMLLEPNLFSFFFGVIFCKYGKDTQKDVFKKKLWQ
jgi:hypothetical protein